MKLALLLTALWCFPLFAQVDLLIEDQRDEGFFLGIDGYLQNEEKLKAIYLTNLDTVSYQVSIRSGETEFTKPVQLREPGLHKYVLLTDYNNELKLRYRGLINQSPSITALKGPKKEISWPEISATVAIAANDEVSADSSADTPRDEGPAVSDPPKDGSSTTMVMVLDHPEVPPTDSTIKKELNTDTAGLNEVPGCAAFTSFLAGMDAQGYEFDRLSMCQEYLSAHRVKSQQIGEMFSRLKYDQTRMQLIRSALNRIIDPENLPDQSKFFEYEITKSKYILLIDEE